MKLLSVFALAAFIIGSVDATCNNCQPPPQCIEADVNGRRGWFQTATDSTEVKSALDGGYKGCPRGQYITSFKAASDYGGIVGLECGCSGGDKISVKTTKNQQQQKPRAFKKIGQSQSEGVIAQPQGFNQLNLFRSNRGMSGINIQLSFLQIILGIILGTPFNCVCPQGYVFSGFYFYYFNYCTKIKFICCPKNNPSSSTGVAASSTAPSTGGIDIGESSPVFEEPSSSTGGGSVNGDPLFIGFLSQQFQVHGMDNTIYNVISTAKLQFNALFTYLNKGECRQGTLCFSHPGNYFGKVGVSIKGEDGKVTQLLVTAGPSKEGMNVTIDGQDVIPSQKHLEIDASSKIYFPNAFDLYVETAEFSIKFENSDMFLNQQVTINTPLMEQIATFKAGSVASVESMPHGILGQTWQRKEYNNRWKYIEGQLFDYIVADGLDGKSFKFNRF